MKFSSKAKPVKIRLAIGSTDFLNVEALRNNFMASELVKRVHDNSLIKWLKQLGETEMVDKLKASGVVSVNERKLYEIFFRHKITPFSMGLLYDYFVSNGFEKNRDQLRIYFRKSSVEDLKTAYNKALGKQSKTELLDIMAARYKYGEIPGCESYLFLWAKNKANTDPAAISTISQLASREYPQAVKYKEEHPDYFDIFNNVDEVKMNNLITKIRTEKLLPYLPLKSKEKYIISYTKRSSLSSLECEIYNLVCFARYFVDRGDALIDVNENSILDNINLHPSNHKLMTVCNTIFALLCYRLVKIIIRKNVFVHGHLSESAINKCNKAIEFIKNADGYVLSRVLLSLLIDTLKEHCKSTSTTDHVAKTCLEKCKNLDINPSLALKADNYKNEFNGSFGECLDFIIHNIFNKDLYYYVADK